MVTYEEALQAVKILVRFMGDDPQREGLQKTPDRFIKAWQEYCEGYNDDPYEYLKTHFEDIHGYSEPILLKDIPFYSHCEHHLAPMHGVVSIAYIPDQKIVGISKLARVVEAFSRRLQIQETLTSQIANCIYEGLTPKGVAVFIKGVHHCMVGRGVNLQGTSLMSYAFRGVYEEHQHLRDSFKEDVK